MFDEVKKYPNCKWCFHSFEFHVKPKSKFSQRKIKIKSYCESCRALCLGKMIKNERVNLQ